MPSTSFIATLGITAAMTSAMMTKPGTNMPWRTSSYLSAKADKIKAKYTTDFFSNTVNDSGLNP